MDIDEDAIPVDATQSIPFEAACDALLSQYLDRLTTLSQAVLPSQTINDAALTRIHDDAMQRRNFIGLFDDHMTLDAGKRAKRLASGTSDLIRLPELLKFSTEELGKWDLWQPEEGEVVLAYLSSTRGYWPGKVSKSLRERTWRSRR